MSQILYALVVLQGATFSVDPGYSSKSECEAMYKGIHTLCFPYDPALNTWSMFFKLPSGGIKAGKGFGNRDECELHISAFKAEIPAVCKPLAYPTTCPPVVCRPAETPPPPPPAKPDNTDPDPKPDPASIMPQGGGNAIQVGGKLQALHRPPLRGLLPWRRPLRE